MYLLHAERRALKDFWVVGSATSRAEAGRKGYTLVKTVGYGLAAAPRGP